MSAQQVFKVARMVVMVTLVSVSTLAFLQTERGRSIYTKYFQPRSVSPQIAVAVSGPEETDPKTSSAVAKTSRSQSEPAEKSSGSPASTTGIPQEKTAGTSPQDKKPGPEIGSGSTVGTTIGSAGGYTTGSSTTTGAAPSAVLVRTYNGQPADVRLKFVLEDMRVDLRKGAQEIADAKGRAPAVAARAALDLIGRSQDRTETLLDVARDIDISRSMKGNLSPSEKAASSEPFTTGAASVPNVTSSWFEPGTILGIVSLTVALLVGWFGDNLSRRFAGRRNIAMTLPAQVAALAGPAGTAQYERQPASTKPAQASTN